MNWAEQVKEKILLFKIDFAKAYDCINWDFLDSILQQMHFGRKWRGWVRGCLSSATVSILVNGSPTPEFSMERGLRQGDPLSPFLFLIAAEALNVMMQEAIQKRLYTPLTVGNSGIVVSLLQFADDALFFG